MTFMGTKVIHPKSYTIGRVVLKSDKATTAMQIVDGEDYTPILAIGNKASVLIGLQLIKCGIKNILKRNRE